MLSITKTSAPVSDWLNLLPTVLFAALLTLASGCSSVPEASPEAKQQSVNATPASGMAGLYVIRPWHLANAVQPWVVRIDYQELGSLGTSCYLYSSILPGKHFLRMNASGDSNEKTFIAKAGQNYYFAINISILGPAFEAIPPAKGQKYVGEYKMSGATDYKAPFNP